MIDKRRAGNTVGVILIALLSGHLMQNADFLGKKAEAVQASLAPIASAARQRAALPVPAAMPRPPLEEFVPAARFDEAVSAGRGVRVAALDSVAGVSLRDVPVPAFAASTCPPQASAEATTGAMVLLAISAPCNRNQRVEIAQGDLAFTEMTDGDGALMIEIPVISETLPIRVSFADGSTATARMPEVSLEGVERVAVSWSGQTDLNIHALEFGADFGESGDVWSGAPGRADALGLGETGHLVALGREGVMNPHHAEVYTFEGRYSERNGTIRMLVEAEVTAGSCGKDVHAQSMQLNGDGAASTTAVTLQLPACGGADGYLVLKNLLRDVKIAAN